MSRRANVIAIVLLGLLVVGMAFEWIVMARRAKKVADCFGRLREFGFAMEYYEGVYKHYPPATRAGDAFPPEKRFSWHTEIIYYVSGYGSGEPASLNIDLSKTWDDPRNSPLTEIVGRDVVRPWIGVLREFHCPSHPMRSELLRANFTDIVGITGIGKDAGLLAPLDPRCGMFNYDRATRRKDLTDGASTTVSIGETSQNLTEWYRGGPGTARGLDVEGLPYLGVDGQFGRGHQRGGPLFPLGSCTNFCFADGSTRTISDQIHPRILESLFTICGGENVPLDWNE